MHNLKITIERLDPTSKQVFRAQSSLSEFAYLENPETLEYAARELARMFNHDYSIERDNLKYMPKSKSDKMIYDEIRDNYYKESDRFRV